MNRDLGLTRTLVQEMRTGGKKGFENFHMLKRFAVFPLSPLAVRVFFGFGFPLRPFVLQALQKAEGVCQIQHLS